MSSELSSHLETSRKVISHPGTKGEASELNWCNMLGKYLPARYRVSKAFVLDSEGQLSEQIDIAIYDRQYSPFLFNEDGALYVPAESIYAVFEVKQELNRSHVKYAGEKAASVRRLVRTTAPITHAGGVFEAKNPNPIIAGILCLESSWNPPLGAPLLEGLAKCSDS